MLNPNLRVKQTTDDKITNWDPELYNKSKVLVDFTFLQDGHQCFSEWSRAQMHEFWNFFRSVQDHTWDQVYRSGGKSGKTSLGYTRVEKKDLPCQSFLDKISEEVDHFFELRVSKRDRVYCFRQKHICYICILDKDHKAFK